MRRLIIQLWQTSPEHPQLAATPFMLAASAAAMDLDVELHALGASVELFVRDNPMRQRLVLPLGRALSAYVEDALRAGARAYACSTAMRDRGLNASEMIDGFSEVLGMVALLERSLAKDVSVLTF